MAAEGQSLFRPLIGPCEIRLLRLKADASGGPLCGTIHHVVLDDAPAYEALSYEWASTEMTHCINIGDHESMRITNSLHNALRDLRHESVDDADREIWADAICINQDDITEREKQVGIMSRIYRQASRVVTYIGPSDESSEKGIDFAYEIFNYCLSKGFINRRWPEGLQFGNGITPTTLPPESDPGWGHIRSIFLRGWAGRCWCAQEFFLNKNLTIMCGRHEIAHWSVIPILVGLTFNRLLPTYLLPDGVEDPKSLKECLTCLSALREYAIFGQEFSLFDLLKSTHALIATDRRDKIYGLLGHAKDRKQLGLAVDYSMSSEELYTAVAKAILIKSTDLELLESNLHEKELTLPSWVPDWSTWLFGSYGMSFAVHSWASGRTQAKPRVLPGTNTLRLRGRILDRVSWVGSPIGPYYEKDCDRVQCQRSDWVREQEHRIQQLEKYPGGHDLSELIWRALICNLTLHSKPAGSHYQKYFDAHMRLPEENSPKEEAMATEFSDAVRRRSRHRRLAITSNGYVGAIGQASQVGDLVCVLHGGRNLYIVREQKEGFAYIGIAYVHGLMLGKALEIEGHTDQDIDLV